MNCISAQPALAQNPAKIDGVPCEVCVSKAVVSQCAQDAREGDYCRADVNRAYLRLEVCDTMTRDCVTRVRELEKERDAARAEAAKNSKPVPARVFFYGAGTGVVVTLAAILVIFAVAD